LTRKKKKKRLKFNRIKLGVYIIVKAVLKLYVAREAIKFKKRGRPWYVITSCSYKRSIYLAIKFFLLGVKARMKAYSINFETSLICEVLCLMLKNYQRFNFSKRGARKEMISLVKRFSRSTRLQYARKNKKFNYKK